MIYAHIESKSKSNLNSKNKIQSGFKNLPLMICILNIEVRPEFFKNKLNQFKHRLNIWFWKDYLELITTNIL